jgi:transposase-like protein
MAHRGPSAAEICLADEDREVLALWSRVSSRRAVRTRIVLACAEPGAANARVAADLGVSRPTVAQWRARFAEAGPGRRVAQHSGAGQVLDRLGQPERAVRRRAPGMDHSLGNPLMIEVHDLLAQMHVVEQRRTPLTDPQAVVGVIDSHAGRGRQHLPALRPRRPYRLRRRAARPSRLRLLPPAT